MKYKMMMSMIVLLLLVTTVSAAHALPANFTDSRGLFEGMAVWSYEVTNGLFWSMLLLGFCVVLFMASSRYTTDRAFSYAAVTGMLGSMFLATLGLMAWWIASMFIIVGAISVAVNIMSGKG